ncbi:hypothetical protein A8B82_13010 [Sulfitobacter sp. EhC04]|nr:hypothetical protein A8B82_13010 [Sulfitobacter sp. EhC04]
MSEIITVGLDLAKNVFQVHGADGTGRAALRKKLRRAQVLEFFSQLPPCVRGGPTFSTILQPDLAPVSPDTQAVAV